MNELQIFKNAEFGEVRAVAHEGQPWFVASDVAKAWSGTDWADRRGWLSMSELLRISQQLGKMSCFSVFSNFAESQKELKTPFEIPFPFFIFPPSPFGKRAVPALNPSSR